MKNTFLEKSHTKSGRGSSPRSFYKKSWLSISTVSTVIEFFVVYPSAVLRKFVKDRVLTTCFNLIQDIIQNRESSGTILPVSYSA